MFEPGCLLGCGLSHTASLIHVAAILRVSCADAEIMIIRWRTIVDEGAPTMSLFFFNFFDGDCHSTDETGVELATIELAYLEARATALQMWPDLLAEEVNPLDCSFAISNEAGLDLMTFDFAELMKAKRSGSARAIAQPEVICSAIAKTHRRAKQAEDELATFIRDARKELSQVRSLLDQMPV